MQQKPDKNPTDAQETPGTFQILGSVLAAFFGVQSDRNRERDFSKGRATPFIVAGVLVTLVFILIVWSVVRLVLANATGV